MQKNAFHTLSYGVYVVTTMDGERPVGCIANSAMQITSQPPTLAISINQQNYTHDIIQKTGKLASEHLGFSPAEKWKSSQKLRMTRKTACPF